ncbi:hypothetical protein [Corallococcus sp. 4LFB]|uniref:hypothetical protein n=1 Tax=Corallococcus sp. 4LFB TaxID=3383249 RepID=UPI0039754A2A
MSRSARSRFARLQKAATFNQGFSTVDFPTSALGELNANTPCRWATGCASAASRP